MKKPRVVIADEDKDYILPLQLKFIEDLYEKIDLEIITDREYFEEFLKTPQKITVLVVSEQLYRQELERHEIKYTFLMYEDDELKEQKLPSSVTKIFKYTSVKEIFLAIRGTVRELGGNDENTENSSKIVLVTSASGGTGKTTIAMGISACLARNYKSVLFIGASYIQDFQRLLSDDTPILSSDVYAALTNPGEKTYAQIKHVVRKDNFDYIPPFKTSIMSLGIPYSVFAAIAASARKSGEYDYIVIDASNFLDERLVELMNISDTVIFVTRQTQAAVYAVNQMTDSINMPDAGSYIFVCNDYKKTKDNAIISNGNRFNVDEYIEHFISYDDMKLEELTESGSIQRLMALLL